jgi:hypothetical protein
LFAAAKAEADTPSRANLPPRGEHLERHRVDASTGQKKTEFYGRESFIKADGGAEPQTG